MDRPAFATFPGELPGGLPGRPPAGRRLAAGWPRCGTMAAARPYAATVEASRDLWPRPVPVVGDRSSAAQRAADPSGWALPEPDRAALARAVGARRDIRRFRPDPVPDELLRRLLAAAHQAPSVGHSQPWRFIVVRDPVTRGRAALLADSARLEQAAAMDAESGRHLLDLDLEGIREAPVGLVVACDRRTPAAGVLGRATYPDSDMWSCACAIQNLWLTARAEGLGVGWVTLFRPDDLAGLVGAPAGVATLGWLCVGWPDERPPDPGLERRGWSMRQPLDEVVLAERWPAGPEGEPSQPPSRLAGRRPAGEAAPGQVADRVSVPTPAQSAVVAARDSGDVILAPPGALGILDRAVDRYLSIRPGEAAAGPVVPPPAPGIPAAVLVLAAADHPVVSHGVSAYEPAVTRTVADAAVAGSSVGAVAAARSGVDLVLVDAGVAGPPVPGARPIRPRQPPGDLVGADALAGADVEALLSGGIELGRELAAGHGLVALGEVGVGNTTVAAALATALLDADPSALVGLGAGSDSAMMASKWAVVTSAVTRARSGRPAGPLEPRRALAALGGGELTVLAGVTLGAAAAGAVVVLDGMATGVAALAATRIEPGVGLHLIAGQSSREPGHRMVLAALGLEPLLDLRLRAGEGVGAVLAVELLRRALDIRRLSARTAPA